jgi:Glycosyl transferase family 2
VQRLSVIMPNHNYGHFVGDAVRSALAVDWPDVEVIVVDDGSTDDSLEVLSGFADRITVISQQNAGPRVACNRGYAASTGDAVLFLDSDDMVEPSLAREVARVWRPGISKIQVQMRRIDGAGRAAGRSFPSYRGTPTADQIRHWMSTTAAYPTPPGSGNVYSREFLDRLMPIDDRCGDATDSATLAAAPYLGDVVTIPRPLVRYRVHGGNRSGVRADPGRLPRQIDRAVLRHRMAREVAGQAEPADGSELVATLRRGRHLLQMRVAASRVCPGCTTLLGDTRVRLLRDAVTSPFAPGPESAPHRMLVALWSLVILAAPAPAARHLVRRRFM